MELKCLPWRDLEAVPVNLSKELCVRGWAGDRGEGTAVAAGLCHLNTGAERGGGQVLRRASDVCQTTVFHGRRVLSGLAWVRRISPARRQGAGV